MAFSGGFGPFFTCAVRCGSFPLKIFCRKRTLETTKREFYTGPFERDVRDIGECMKRKSLFLIFGLVYGCLLAPALAQEPPPELVAVTEKQMGFYENPSQETFAEIVAAQNGFMQWARENISPDRVEHMDRLFRTFVSFAWKQGGYAGSPFPEKEMNGIVKSVSKEKIRSPEDLDALWAAFFATGEEKYLDRLTDAASVRNPIIAGAAKWSLNANYRQRPAVKEYFDRQPGKKEAIIR